MPSPARRTSMRCTSGRPAARGTCRAPAQLRESARDRCACTRSSRPSRGAAAARSGRGRAGSGPRPRRSTALSRSGESRRAGSRGARRLHRAAQTAPGPRSSCAGPPSAGHPSASPASSRPAPGAASGSRPAARAGPRVDTNSGAARRAAGSRPPRSWPQSPDRRCRSRDRSTGRPHPRRDSTPSRRPRPLRDRDRRPN